MAKHKTPPKTTTYRQRVLDVLNAAGTRASTLTGKDIATRADLTYRQTIDALNALHHMARVQRTGRKITARWSRAQPKQNPASALELAFRGFFK